MKIVDMYYFHALCFLWLLVPWTDLDFENIMLSHAGRRWLGPHEVHAILCNYKHLNHLISVNNNLVYLPKSNYLLPFSINCNMIGVRLESLHMSSCNFWSFFFFNSQYSLIIRFFVIFTLKNIYLIYLIVYHLCRF